MRKIILILAICTIGTYAESDSVWNCIIEHGMNMAATQSVFGDYRLVTSTDTLEGRFFYIPPHTTYITVDDSVHEIPFMSLKDPWFEWWVERNPLHRKDLYTTVFVKDSLSFLIYNHISDTNEYSNVRVAYDSGSCEIFSAFFYWPEDAGHGFPGADAIYYEFFITDRSTIAPSKRQYFNKLGEVVEELICENIIASAKTPQDSVIIRKLLSDETFE